MKWTLSLILPPFPESSFHPHLCHLSPLALILVVRKREDMAILCQEAEDTQDFKQITQTS